MKTTIRRITTIIMLCLVLISCITEKMWKPSIYSEPVDSFLLTEDKNKLVIIGEKYHYIFTVNDNLRKILELENRKNITADFKFFNVLSDGKISGKYTLRIHIKESNVGDINRVLDAGFKKIKTKSYGDDAYFYRSSIAGMRYVADKSIKTKYRFNKKYSITVEEKFSLTDKIGKGIVTPVTVAADGTLAISGMSLLLVSVIIGNIFLD